MVPSSLLEESPCDLGLNLSNLCLFLSDGYFLHAEPYCGKNTDFPETGLDQGSDVLLGVTENCDLTKASTVEMDNFFTALPLLDKLMDMGMYGVGTIRENRLQGASLKKKAALQRETRGTFDYTSDCLERQQVCHCCHQLFVAKSSFVNKALVESSEKTCRRTNAKSFQAV